MKGKGAEREGDKRREGRKEEDWNGEKRTEQEVKEEIGRGGRIEVGSGGDVRCEARESQMDPSVAMPSTTVLECPSLSSTILPTIFITPE